uniref:C2H2-type domain-containing protein n=1 Tax=Sphenodon punctatus TaxID=8508 RepID=A0A8D0GBC5_SPHPU
MLFPLTDYAISKPDILSRMEQGEEPCVRHPGDTEESKTSTDPSTESPACVREGVFLIKQEKQLGLMNQQDLESKEMSQERYVGFPISDILAWVKQEEEPCVVDQPSLADRRLLMNVSGDHTACQSDTLPLVEDGKKLLVDVHPASQGTETPTDPCAGFPISDILAWVKQEEEPCVGDQPNAADGRLPMNVSGENPGEHLATIPCDPRLLERPQEKIFQNPNQGAAWGSQCRSEGQPANQTEDTLGLARYDEGCSKLLDCFSRQESHPRDRPHAMVKDEKSSGPSLCLQSHRRVPPREELYQCHVCEGSFQDQAALVCHGRLHTHDKHSVCPEREEGFMELTVAASHQSVDAGERPQAGIQCDGSFTDQSDLSRDSQIHSEESPVPVSEHGKRFPGKCRQTNRSRIYNGKKRGECGKSFRTEKSVASSQKSLGIKTLYQCSQCEKSFAFRSRLLRHQMIHTGERLLKCTVCEKGFMSPSHLARHHLSNTRERPFKCTMCEKSFRNRSELARHHFIHNGEKPFKCTMCERSFISQADLGRHQFVHTLEKPFRCTECGKEYRRKESIRDHQRLHSGENGSQCAACGKTFVKKRSLGSHQKICPKKETLST